MQWAVLMISYTTAKFTVLFTDEVWKFWIQYKNVSSNNGY